MESGLSRRKVSFMSSSLYFVSVLFFSTFAASMPDAMLIFFIFLVAANQVAKD